MPFRGIQEQIDDLRRAGIHRACGAPIRQMGSASFTDIRALNDQALALRDRFPDFYIPGIHIHPRFPDESCAEIERCAGHGVRWIGELVGYMMGFGEEYATPAALAVMRVAARHRMVVNIHCGNLEVVEQLCRGVPDLQVVLAHPGAGRGDILLRLAKVAEHPLLHLDISGSGIDRYGMIRAVIDRAGRKKILFGTDAPINNPAVYVGGARFEALDEAERAALFSGNFRRLCGMG
jgi:predicted TIM-barrel fold metal-dependent hydrolase